jgi:hypothetical protein
MIRLTELACCCFVVYSAQRYVENLGATMFWQFLLGVPPGAIILEIFAEFQRRDQLKKAEKEASKIEEEEEIYKWMKVFAKEHYIWCRNERVSKEPTLCFSLDCQYKNYSSDIPTGCSKCRLFQITDQNMDWQKAKRTHDFATVNPKEENKWN